MKLPVLIAAIASLATTLSAQEMSKTFSYSKQVGSPSSFSAYMNTQLSGYNRSHQEINANAQASAGGSVIGIGFEMLNLQGNASAIWNVGMHADMTVKALGQTVFSQGWDGPTINVPKIPIKKSFDKPTEGEIIIGGFPIAYTIGTAGEVGADISFKLDSGSLNQGPTAVVKVTPRVSSGGYARLAIGLSCCLSAGVGADLTVLEDVLPITLNIDITPDPARVVPSWGIRYRTNASIRLTMLAGEVYAFLKIGLGPFFSDTMKATIFGWDGLVSTKTLVDDTSWVSINEPFPMITSLGPSAVNTGTDPVTLNVYGIGISSNGATVYWNGVPQATTRISATQLQITIPGSVHNVTDPTTFRVTVQTTGLYAGTSNEVAFLVDVPQPTLISMSPGAATAGGGQFSLTLNGTGLLPGSTVYWASTALATTYISDFQVQAVVPADLTLASNTANVTLRQARGVSSNPIQAQVYAPEPAISKLTPPSLWPQSPDTTITVTGTGYLPSSQVYISGSPVSTQYVSGTSLQAVVPSASLTSAGTLSVEVITPGYIPSAAVSLPVANRTYTAYPFYSDPGTTRMTFGVSDSGQVCGALFGPYGSTFTTFGMATQLDGSAFSPYVATIFNSQVSSFAGAAYLSCVKNGQMGGVGMTTSTNAFGYLGVYRFNSIGLNTGLTNDFRMVLDINSNGMAVGFNANKDYIVGKYDGAVQAILPGTSGAGTAFAAVHVTKYPVSGASRPGGPTVGLKAGRINESNDVVAMDGSYWIGGGGSRQQLPRGPYSGTIWALGMNNSRTIVGSIGNNSARYLTGLQAVKWMPDGTIVPLNFDGGVPLSINDSGDIVGENSNKDGVIFTGGALRKLKDLVPNVNWTGKIETAVDISPNGTIAAVLVDTAGIVGTVVLVPDPVVAPAPALTSHAATVLSSTRAKSAAKSMSRVAANVFSLSPAAVTAGASDFQMTVTGNQFLPGAIVYWNGSPLATSYVDGQTLQATVTAGLVANSGSATVTVLNPAGNPSNALVFSINSQVPTITSLSPGSVYAGGQPLYIAVIGTGFNTGSKIYWSGTELDTHWSSSTYLVGYVPAALTALPGTGSITVVNPNPGAASSDPKLLPVAVPTPLLDSMSTTAATVGSGDLDLMLFGSNFNLTSVVTWEDQTLTTTYMSPIRLRATVPASLLAKSGYASVRVTDTIPGSNSSQILQFEIDSPDPSVSSVTPQAIAEGATGATITVNGSGFVSGSKIYLDKHALSTNYVSPTMLTATLSSNDNILASGQTIRQLTVKNPTPVAHPISGAIPLTITAAPRIYSMAPAMARTGTSSVSLSVTGAGFTNQSVVLFNGTSLSTSYVSSTQLTATVPANSLAIAGDFAVKVTAGSPSDPTVGISDPVAFSVSNAAPGVPTLTSISPTSAVVGSKSQVVTVKGSGFTSGSVALWNGTPMASAFVSPTQMMFLAPAANLTAPGSASIQIRTSPDNTSAGGGTSANTSKFNILGAAGTSVQIIATNQLTYFDPYSGYTVFQITLSNIGTGTANNLVLATAKLGGQSPSGLYINSIGGPLGAGNLMPGNSTVVYVNFFDTGLVPGVAQLGLTGTYTGGSFSSNARVNLQLR